LIWTEEKWTEKSMLKVDGGRALLLDAIEACLFTGSEMDRIILETESQGGRGLGSPFESDEVDGG
jgi:hypothetical protein